VFSKLESDEVATQTALFEYLNSLDNINVREDDDTTDYELLASFFD
jgi:hypothetical protein